MDDDLVGRVWCLSCSEADCVTASDTSQAASYRCVHCGPVVRCPSPVDVEVPACYVRSLDELSDMLDDTLDYVPPLVIEPSEFRCSGAGCLACGGSVTFLYWTDEREIDGGAQCHRCGDVALVKFDPVEPTFRPVVAPRLVHSRKG